MHWICVQPYEPAHSLFLAIQRGDLPSFERHLHLHHPKALFQGHTALATAIVSNQWACFKALLPLSDLSSMPGMVPHTMASGLLHLAVSRGSLNMLDALLEHPLILSQINDFNALDKTPLMLAVLKNQPPDDQLQRLLPRSACLKTNSIDEDALTLAIGIKNTPALTLLLPHAQPFMTQAYWKKLMHLAQEGEFHEGLRVLQDFQAQQTLERIVSHGQRSRPSRGAKQAL